MADITRRLGWRHLRGAPTAHIRRHRSGRLVHDGPGLSFWYRSLTAALSEIPVDDRELAMTFHARTSDFQDVAVQATVTYRVSDPAMASARLDFSIDPDTGVWRGAPLEQLSKQFRRFRRFGRGLRVSLAPRVVPVHRATEYEELVARHGTHGQAAFFLRSRGRDIEDAAERHRRERGALAEVMSADAASGSGGAG